MILCLLILATLRISHDRIVLVGIHKVELRNSDCIRKTQERRVCWMFVVVLHSAR